MRVYLPNDSHGRGIGGGWTFRDNLYAASPGIFDVVEGGEWDVALISGATMVSRDTVKRMLKAPGKVILRIDGIPEDWRNRGTGWPRLRDFAAWADGVIYQSEFSRDTVGRVLGRSGPVIFNGTDTDTFNSGGPRNALPGSPSVLCINYRQDPNKRIQESIIRFREFKLDHPEAVITFAGVYPKLLSQYKFGMLDWERGKDWMTTGVVLARRDLAQLMRSHDYIAYPAFADPCPNTLIEALACGCEPLWINDYGGAMEIVERWFYTDWTRERMATDYLEAFEHVC